MTWAYRAARMNWCRHLGFRRADRNTLMITDESRLNISHTDGRIVVYCMRGERSVETSPLEVSVGGGCVMIRRFKDAPCSTWQFECSRYINQILVSDAVPFNQRQPYQVALQQDNARPHTARVTQQFLKRIIMCFHSQQKALFKTSRTHPG